MADREVPLQSDAMLECFHTHYRRVVCDRLRPDHARGLPAQVAHILSSFLLSGGKRMRPLLLMLSYGGYKDSYTRASFERTVLPAATGIEMLHHFALIHDDLVDHSPRRRNQPSLHVQLGEFVSDAEAGRDLACLAGDYLYTLAIEEFVSMDVDPARSLDALRVLLDAGVRTGGGGVLEVWWRRTASVIGREDAIEVLSGKTAYYSIVGPLCIGAILAGAPEEELALLRTAGVALGLAYQIADDLDDISTLLALTDVVGPSAWREVGVMYPVSILNDQLLNDDRQLLDHILRAGGEEPNLRVALSKLMGRYGIRKEASREAIRLAKEGMESLQKSSLCLLARTALIDLFQRRFSKSLDQVEHSSCDWSV